MSNIQHFQIAMAQGNFTVGDFQGNLAKIKQQWQEAAKMGADLVVFPEMAITGYPVEDLALRRSFQQTAIESAQQLIDFSATMPCEAILGGIWREGDEPTNSIFWLAGGKMLHTQHKVALPNYGVFDEKRIFLKGQKPSIIHWRGIKIGMLICEDLWHEDVAQHLAQQGAQLFITIHGSPYETSKREQRFTVARRAAGRFSIPLIYNNLCGGQDELVFDGNSFVMAADESLPVTLPHCDEAITLTHWQEKDGIVTCESDARTEEIAYEERIYQVITCGLRDYVEKSHFEGVVIALSGGVDSALTAAVAVDALGADKVHTVFMPSPFTTQESIEDAKTCAQMLGTKLDVIPIDSAVQMMHETLTPVCAEMNSLTQENIQARMRGNLLMAISNQKGWMVLTTGNKSEMSVGYATLYGDMCGGYSVLKDIYKTTVFRLCEWRNANLPAGALGPKGTVMPERVITKPPSAELRPGQKDEDSLPPYETLDKILRELIEHQSSVSSIVAKGFDEDTVREVSRLLYRAEYKRRQAPPGVRVTAMSFGRDRRYPIVNRYRG
jgi:NAD+ synthase